MLLLMILIFLAWGLTVVQMDRWGAFDGSGEFAPVADSRKRFHADEDIATHTVLDAVPWGDRLVVSLGNGQNLQYDPGMDLWDNLPSLPQSLRDRRAVQVRAGNGHMDQSFDASSDRLFARTPTGGLAVLIDGKWRVVSHDTQFTGLNGRPVSWSDVTAAAVSGDRRFLLLGCRTQGIGLYSIRHRVWLNVMDAAKLKAVGAIREIVWWSSSDCFALAGEKQLVLFRIDRDSPDQESQLAQTIEFPEAFAREIVDIHVTPKGRLWVLDRNLQAPHQTRIAKWDSSESRPQVELQENEVIGSLTHDDLNFAMQIGDRLFVCGEATDSSTAGVLEYNCDRHAWTRRSAEPVTASLRHPDGQSFFVGTAKGVDQFPSGQHWNFDEIAERSAVRRLLWGRAGEILAQLDDDRIFSLQTNQRPVEVFHAPSAEIDLATVHSAFDLDGTHILLVSAQGLVLHNTRTRDYQRRRISDENKWLSEQGLKFAAAGRSVFFQSNDGRVHVLPLRSLIEPAEWEKGWKSQQLAPGSAAALVPMSESRVAVLDAAGVLHRVDSGSGPVALGGRPFPDAAGKDPAFLDAAGPSDGVLRDCDTAFLFPSQLTVHRADRRIAQNYSLPEGETIHELAAVHLKTDAIPNRLLITSSDGDIFDFRSQSDRFPPKGTTSVLLGGDGRLGADVDLGIRDSELSDVRVDTDGDLYLAGAGRVVRYSPARRQVIERWTYPGGGNVELVGVRDRQPVAVTGGQVYHGTRAKLNSDWKAATVSLFKEQLWITATGPDSERRLRWYSDVAASQHFDFFSNPKSAAKVLVDAVPLADDNVLVSTDAGLRVYNPAARSWYWFEDQSLLAGAELYRLGSYILAAQPTADREYNLAAFQVDSLTVPYSPDRYFLKWTMSPWQTRSSVPAFAVDALRGEFVFIHSDSSVHRWRPGRGNANGTTIQEIASAGRTPQAKELKRCVVCGAYLVFAADQELWTYHMSQHTWRKLNMSFPDSGRSRFVIQSLEKESSAERVWCSVQRDGNLLIGSWETKRPDSPVALKAAFRAGSTRFAGDPAQIIDVQQTGDVLTMLQSDRVDWFHPGRREHSGGTPFPGAKATDQPDYGLQDGRRVAANSSGRFWIAATRAEFPSRFQYVDVEPDRKTEYAFDRNATVWRRRPDGVVEFCSVDSTSNSAYRSFNRHVAPMEIQRTDVQRVFRFRNRWSILLTADGARVYDEARYREVAVAEVSLATHSQPLSSEDVTWFEEDGSLWIVREGSILQLAGTPENSKRPIDPAPRHFRGPLEMQTTASGQHWVRTTAGWHFFNADRREFSPVPRSAASPAQPALKLFVQSDVLPTAIDIAKGQLLSWNESGTWDAPSAAVLPAGYPTEEIRWLIRDAQTWWVLFQDRVERLARRRTHTSKAHRLETVETFVLPTAIRKGLNTAQPTIRVNGDAVEYSGVRSSCRVRPRREVTQPDGSISFVGGLQWWTSRVADVPFAKQLDPQTDFVFYDETAQCGWLVTGNQSRFFVLDATAPVGSRTAKSGSDPQDKKADDTTVDRIAFAAASAAASQSRRTAGVLWSQPCRLDAATQRALAASHVQLAFSGFRLSPLQRTPNDDAWGSVRTSAVEGGILSRRIPELSTEPLLAVPSGTSLRLMARCERFSVGTKSSETWYRAMRDDVGVLWAPAAGLDLANARVSSETVMLREAPDEWAASVGLLRKGMSIDVVEADAGWVQLCLTECEVGWLPESAVAVEAGARWSQAARGATQRAREFQRQLSSARVELRTDGSLLSVIGEMRQTSEQIRSAALPSVTRELAEPEWQALIERLPNGRSAWQAVSGLAVRDGSLWAVRSVEDVRLAEAGAFLDANRIAVDPPLDLAWLRWNRDAKSFELSCVGGVTSFSPTQMLVSTPEGGTQFLFEPADGLVCREPAHTFVSNRHGVWQYSTDTLSLTQGKADSVVFQPHESAVALLPFVGGFADSHEDYIEAVRGMPVTRGYTGRHDIRVGAVTFTESVERTALQVQLARTDGTLVPRPVLSDLGFAWDQRRSLAINSQGLLLQSDAGLHQHASVSRSQFAAGPRPAGRLFSENHTTTWLQHENEWFSQTSAVGKWARHASPRLDRDLARAADWLWRRSAQGEITVACAGPSVGFRLIADGVHPVYFTSDLLGDAAAHDGELHLVTQAAHQFETLPVVPPAALAYGQSLNRGTNRVSLPPDTGFEDVDLDVRRNRQFGIGRTGEVLYRMIKDNTSAWNASRARFERVTPADDPAVSDDPHVLQRLAGTARLRFWRHNGTQIRKDVRLDQATGGSSWVTYRFSACTGPDGTQQSRFPFDRATSVAARFGRLFIGTDAGLQITSDVDGLSRRFDLHQPELKLLDVRDPQTVSTVDPVNRVGIPFADREVLGVRSGSRCFVTKDGVTFTKYDSSELLDERLRLQNALWQWREERRADAEALSTSAMPDGNARVAAQLTGRYINERRKYASSPIDLAAGRLPHDRISDATHYRGQTFTLWGDGWVTAHAGDEADLHTAFTNFDLRATGPADLFVVRHRNMELRPGLYYRNETRQVWHYDSATNRWSRVSSADEATRLIAYAVSRPVYSEDRIRLVRTPDGPFHFQHRTRPTSEEPHGRWREIPWVQRHGSVKGTSSVKYCLACDQWNEFVHDRRTDTLWAATPMGFCHFRRVPGSSHRPASGTTPSRNAPGRVVLRLDEFHAAREHADRKLSPVTELRVEAGQRRESTAFPVLFRRGYDSGQVYAATLDPSRDTGVLPQKPQSGPNFVDPFAESDHVKTDYWQWRLIKRQGAHATGTRRSQPGYLVGRLFTSRPTERKSGSRREGEEIVLASGRFCFDSPASLLADGESVQLVAPAADQASCAGWMSIAGDDLHLRHWQRPVNDGHVSEKVRRIFPGRDTSGMRVTGLLLNSGKAVTATGQKTHSIPPRIAAGEDGFWSYSQVLLSRSREISTTKPMPKSSETSGGLIVNVKESENRLTRRTLEDGQFTDDIVIGLPVQRDGFPVGGKSSGLEYVLPTRAGIEQRRADFERLDVFRPKPLSAATARSDQQGSGTGTTVPAVLYVDRENHIRAVRGRHGQSTFVQLVRINFFNGETGDAASDTPSVSTDAGISNLPKRQVVSMTLPPSAVPLSVSRDLSGHIRLRWKQPGTYGWSLCSTTDSIDAAESSRSLSATRSTNTMILPVGGWRRFEQNRYRWGNPPPVFALQFLQQKQRLSFFHSTTAEGPHDIAVPDEPQVNALTFGTRLLLITKQGIHQLELNHPLVTAFSQTARRDAD